MNPKIDLKKGMSLQALKQKLVDKSPDRIRDLEAVSDEYTGSFTLPDMTPSFTLYFEKGIYNGRSTQTHNIRKYFSISYTEHDDKPGKILHAANKNNDSSLTMDSLTDPRRPLFLLLMNKEEKDPDDLSENEKEIYKILYTASKKLILKIHVDENLALEGMKPCTAPLQPLAEKGGSEQLPPTPKIINFLRTFFK
ncbi:MAG: hypothetical protein ACTSXQ_06930 [Alphaproteobacteria bacterium]